MSTNEATRATGRTVVIPAILSDLIAENALADIGCIQQTIATVGYTTTPRTEQIDHCAKAGPQITHLALVADEAHRATGDLLLDVDMEWFNPRVLRDWLDSILNRLEDADTRSLDQLRSDRDLIDAVITVVEQLEAQS